MDFTVCDPLRIQLQAKGDECTSCSLAAIAEDVLKVPVDADYIYNNSSDGYFGITPDKATQAVFDKGVKTIGGVNPAFPFKSYKKAWPWVFRFDSIISMMQKNNRSFFCGIFWQTEWTDLTDGVMTMPAVWNTNLAHAFKVYGTKRINGKIYLKVQNSLGSLKGDGGIWYMPREIATKLSFAYQLL